jgi:hypothetical protein
MEQNLELSNGTIKIDIYQHLKLGVLNKEKNCKCDNNIEAKFYCIPCKISCCTKCTLEDHKMHLLVAKGDFDMQPKQIQKSFKALEEFMEKDELFRNVEKKRQELIKEVENTYDKLLKMINDWKSYKINEINELFSELMENVKNVNDKKKESKNALNNYAKKYKDFLSLGDKNKDQNNTMFLINYDLLSISYLWSENLAKIGNAIQGDMNQYKQREKAKNKYITDGVHDLLFNKDDEDLESHEKVDPKFLPLVKLKVEIKDFNPDKLKDIEKRMGKFNKGVDSFKQAVMNSVNKHGNYRDIERENNIFEHRKVKGADNLFSQRKADTQRGDDDNALQPNKQIKNKNDIVLDNQVLNKYFAHILTDIYDQYFRIPTIELQSSHADLKIKKDEDVDEMNVAKVIEGTDRIMIYDKKACKLTKKKVNLQKNPHGYTKFPLGCRSVLVGDKLYITGGKDEYREYPNSLIYDRKTEKIKRIMDMQNARCYHTMIFNEIFETMMVIGGENNDTVEIFDPLTNRWQLLPELNIPRAIPLFHFDEGRGNMYALFGVEGNYLNSNYTDTIEVLDLTEIKQGWMKINYNNKARMDFKNHLNFYPLNDYLLLIYGAFESRASKRNACTYHLIKAEMNAIDKNLMDDLRNEAKNNKLLSSIVASVSRSSMSELSEGTKKE